MTFSGKINEFYRKINTKNAFTIVNFDEKHIKKIYSKYLQFIS